MITQYRRSVCVSFSSDDWLICSELETTATLYQKEPDRFHLLLTEPPVDAGSPTTCQSAVITTPRLLWVDFSPYRATVTMQGSSRFSYRHRFEPGVFGLSRYCLQDEQSALTQEFLLRNFTRNLHMKGHPYPQFLLLEYDLWTDRMPLGRYLLQVEVQP